jgi:hypothetical protein
MEEYDEYEDEENDYDSFERNELNKIFGEGAAEQDGFGIFNVKNNQETERITSLATKTNRVRERVRRIDQDFRMMGYGSIGEMSEKIKIPRVRNSYLREAFFKCYFQGPYFKEKDYVGAFNIFASLFFYKQEIRQATREKFDANTKENIVKSDLPSLEYTDEYFTLLHYLKGIIFDGFKTIASLPQPEIILPPDELRQDPEKFMEFISKKELVKITFKPKKSDYPDTTELFLNLSGGDSSDIIQKNGETYLQLFEKDYGHLNFGRISNQLWLQTFAFVVYEAVKEIEQEILQSEMLHAKINVTNIKQAISHFEQNHPDAKHMDNYQKAYYICHRYRKRSTGNTNLERSSILKALKRAD